MKIVSNLARTAVASTPRQQGQVTEKDGQFFLCVKRLGHGTYIVSLRDSTVAPAHGEYLTPGERLCDKAEFYPDGVPLPHPAPVPVPKSKEQHAQEFIKYYWGHPAVSGASNLVSYSVSEILEGRTNVNTRRCFAAWLAARGV